MKKATMKGLSLALATMLSMSTLAVSASAQTNPEDYDMQWTLRASGSRADTVYINPEDLAGGNYTLNVSVFVETEEQAPPETLECVYSTWRCVSEDGRNTRYMRIQNQAGAADFADELVLGESVAEDHPMAGLNEDGTVSNGVTDEILDGVIVKYLPTCLTQVVTRRGETYTTSKWIDPKYSVEKFAIDNPAPTYGYGNQSVTVYSAGPGKVKFTNPFTEKEYICDVIYDDETQCDAHFDAREFYREFEYREPTAELLQIWDEVCGIGTEEEYFEYHYNRDIEFKTRLMSYNPNIPEGEPLPDYASFSRTSMFNPDRTHPMQWLGGHSDDFALVTFDVVFDEDTPEGVYYVSFDQNKPQKMVAVGVDEDGHNVDLDFDANGVSETANWLKVVVGDGEAEAPVAETANYDVNADGIVDMRDASAALSIYAQKAAGMTLYQSNGDADDKTDYFALTVDILGYCAKHAAGLV